MEWLLSVLVHWLQCFFRSKVSLDATKKTSRVHVANDEQSRAVNELVIAKKVDPCLSETYSFDQIGHTHQLMHDIKHPHGNMACLVNSLSKGQGRS